MKAGQNPDPSQLYLAQLLLWGLDSGKVIPRHDLLDRIRVNTESLLGLEPEEGHRWLLGPEPGLWPRDLEGTPESAAEAVFEQLHGRLTEELPDYPRANPLP